VRHFDPAMRKESITKSQLLPWVKREVVKDSLKLYSNTIGLPPAIIKLPSAIQCITSPNVATKLDAFYDAVNATIIDPVCES
jgi:hypothetical protein